MPLSMFVMYGFPSGLVAFSYVATLGHHFARWPRQKLRWLGLGVQQAGDMTKKMLEALHPLRWSVFWEVKLSQGRIFTGFTAQMVSSFSLDLQCWLRRIGPIFNLVNDCGKPNVTRHGQLSQLYVLCTSSGFEGVHRDSCHCSQCLGGTCFMSSSLGML